MSGGSDQGEWREIGSPEEAESFVASCADPTGVEITHVPDCDVLERFRAGGLSYERAGPRRWYVEPTAADRTRAGGDTDGSNRSVECAEEETADRPDDAGTFAELTPVRKGFLIVLVTLTLVLGVLLAWEHFRSALETYGPLLTLIGALGVFVTIIKLFVDSGVLDP